MAADWESSLRRWLAAGLLDDATSERIRQWEAEQGATRGLRWPVLIAIALGTALLAAGVLLFVSAHWDEISPAARMALVVALVAVFHVAGSLFSTRFAALSVALHTAGTVALGAGILLAGQIFNMAEHWPDAILLWAVGMAIAWVLLRHWTQAALVAVFLPAWLLCEYASRLPLDSFYSAESANAGLVALAFAYLGARRMDDDTVLRRALAWIGGLILLPAALALAVLYHDAKPAPLELAVPAWTIAIILPLTVAIGTRGRAAIDVIFAIGWATALPLAARFGGASHWGSYAWCAIGAVWLAWWGVRDARPERVNLAMAGFAADVCAFYFSNVMDKLGRSASLIGLGLLFLAGGWVLEHTRRRLLARIRPEVIP